MGSLCSKDRTTVDINRCVTPGSRSTDRLLPHQILTYEVTAQADSTGIAAQANSLPSSLARQCALALCTTLDSTLQPIAGRLSLHIHSDLCSTSRRTSVQHLQTLVQDSLPDTAIQATASTVAVLYTLIVAATTQLQASLSSRCTAVNLLISSLSILLSTADIKQEPATVWQTWQSLLWAVGLDSCHVCAVLNPTCKATLIRLQTAATQPCLSVKLKINRASAFEDASLGLQAADTPSTTGPCVVFPSFVTSVSTHSTAHLGSHTEAHGTEAHHSEAHLSEAQRCEAHEFEAQQASLEEGGEGYGPRREFFLLAGQAMIKQAAGVTGQPPLFVYNSSAACYCYNTSLQKQGTTVEAYRIAGWLAGQSIHNRACLGIKLAAALWQKVLEGDRFQASMAVLQEFDPAAAQALSKLKSSSSAELQALLQLEELPLDMTAAEFTSRAVQRILVEAVQWQSEAFAQGFTAALSPAMLKAHLVSPTELAAMISGSSTPWSQAPRLQDVFQVILDQQLQHEYALLAEVFWEVVNGWSVELKMQLLLFLTGSQRLPQPGTEVLRIELPFVAFNRSEHQAMLSRLPQAHTCDNILELPNYLESMVALSKAESRDLPEKQLRQALAQSMDDRLRLAISCSTYGLDEKVQS